MNASAKAPESAAVSDSPQALPQVWKWRGTIAVEGKPSIDERLVLPGAFTWKPEPLALVQYDQGAATRIGTVATIRRRPQEDGTTLIRAEGEITLALWDMRREGLGVSVDGVLFAAERETPTVKHGRIHHVSVDASPIWEECTFDLVEVPL